MPQPRKLHDQYFKQAKAEGYLARSAYKLIEINEKRRIVHLRDRVLDMGCAPGSWLQVVEKIIGPRGTVIGIDLQKVEHRFGHSVRTMVGDALSGDTAPILALAGGQFQVVLSDMAPNTTGHGDDLLSARMCRRILELLPTLLRPGGHVLMKVLEGSDMPELLREVRPLFNESGATKPAASRDVSREIFIFGKCYRPPPVPSTPPPGPPTVSPGWSSPSTDSRTY